MPVLPNPPMSFSVPAQAVGAALVYFDFWNGAAEPMLLQSLKIIKDGTVAVSGVVSVKLFLTRTSAIGTGGTAAVIEGTDPTVMSFARSALAFPVDPSISGRLTPTGGATAGAVLGERQIFTEETNALHYGPPWPDFVDAGQSVGFLIPAGTGFRVLQSSVASVGNIGFNGIFSPVAV